MIPGMSAFTAVDQRSSLTRIPDPNFHFVGHQICKALPQPCQQDSDTQLPGLNNFDFSANMSTSGRKRRRSARIAVTKRRKSSIQLSENFQSDLRVDDENSSEFSRILSSCSSTSTSTDCDDMSTSLTSSATDDDMLGLKDFLSDSMESSPVHRITRSIGSQPSTRPASRYNTRSNSNASDLWSATTDDLDSSDHFDFLKHQSARDVANSPANSGMRLSPRLAASSADLPGYKFVDTAPPSPMPEKISSSDEPFAGSLPNAVENSAFKGQGPLSEHGVSFKSTLSVFERNLLGIKLRPVAEGKSRALPVKVIPPLYVPILPPVLAWCLVEGAEPDPEDDWTFTDRSSLLTAKHVTGLRVLKRNVTRLQRQQRGKRRVVHDSTDDELLHEYLSAVTKKESTKKVSFDDSAARIVLADWKGISVEDL